LVQLLVGRSGSRDWLPQTRDILNWQTDPIEEYPTTTHTQHQHPVYAPIVCQRGVWFSGNKFLLAECGSFS
jgi:hypothetical protein